MSFSNSCVLRRKDFHLNRLFYLLITLLNHLFVILMVRVIACNSKAVSFSSICICPERVYKPKLIFYSISQPNHLHLILYNNFYSLYIVYINFLCFLFFWQSELDWLITHPVPTYISTVPAATLPFEIPALAVKVGFEPTSALVTIYLYILNLNLILIEIARVITPHIVFKQFRTCFRKISFTNGWTRTNTALPIAYHIRLMTFQ